MADFVLFARPRKHDFESVMSHVNTIDKDIFKGSSRMYFKRFAKLDSAVRAAHRWTDTYTKIEIVDLLTGKMYVVLSDCDEATDCELSI